MRLTAFLVAMAVGAGAFAQSDLPRRKSGLWYLTITSSSGPPMNFHECVDRNTDDLTKPESLEGTTCSKDDVRRQGAGYVIETVCKTEGVTERSRFVLSGNFDSAYTLEGKTTFQPPREGVSELTQKTEARWIGATCKPGQEPGDMTLVDTPPARGAMKGARKKP